MTLAEFLLARIAEDEAAVNDRTRRGGAFADWEYVEQFGDFGDDERWMIEVSPNRVLAECEAKRLIVEHAQRISESGFVEGGIILSALAAPYADHPDYREEWRL